jgi:Endoribonuclease L-PSP
MRRTCGCPTRRRSRSRAALPSISRASRRRRSITTIRTGPKSSTPCRATWRARRAALENLKRGLEATGATFADVVTASRFVTDLADQDALNRVWAEYFRNAKPATTTVQVVRLATDPRCLVEINAIAVIN